MPTTTTRTERSPSSPRGVSVPSASTLLALRATARSHPCSCSPTARRPLRRTSSSDRRGSRWSRRRQVTDAIQATRGRDVRGKRVLLREDLNAPMKNGAIADETRITAVLPTLRWLREHGARTVILSTSGAPTASPTRSFRCADPARLAELLETPVGFVDDCIGDAAVAASNALAGGGFVMFENVRFHPEEEADDPGSLASSRAAATCTSRRVRHRASRARIDGRCRRVPAVVRGAVDGGRAGRAVAVDRASGPSRMSARRRCEGGRQGRLFENLIAKVDAFTIGGGMGHTFLAAQGIDVGVLARSRPAARAADHRARAIARRHPAPPYRRGGRRRVRRRRHSPRRALAQVGSGMILDIGPADRPGVRRRAARGQDDRLQRPDGVYEKPPTRTARA